MHDAFRCSLKRHVLSWSVVLVMAVGLFGSVSAAGQTGTLETRGAGFKATVNPGGSFDATVTPKVSSDPIDPFRTYSNASYGTGGIALRNRGTGVLHVSGVTGPVQDAYLYWAILFSPSPPGKNLYQAQLARILPPPTYWPVHPLATGQESLPSPTGPHISPSNLSVTLDGTLLGIGTDPNWGSRGVAVFRAQVPSWIATGNGVYQVTIASGRTDGSDPWVSSTVFPLAEGASLLIVGTGDYTVGIYDAGFTANTFCATEMFAYTLNFPASVTTDALWDEIGADGQVGAGRLEARGVDSEDTTINSTLVAGPGTRTLNPDSDWNGNAGFPLPQLWDDTGHDIFTAVRDSANAAISIYSPGDCLVTVFNVMAVQ